MVWGTKTKYWHTWFAWRPVQFEDGRWVWFERVDRIAECGGYAHLPHRSKTFSE